MWRRPWCLEGGGLIGVGVSVDRAGSVSITALLVFHLKYSIILWGKYQGNFEENILRKIRNVGAKVCKRMFLTYSLIQMALHPGCLIYYIWGFIQKYIFRCFAPRFGFLTF